MLLLSVLIGAYVAWIQGKFGIQRDKVNYSYAVIIMISAISDINIYVDYNNTSNIMVDVFTSINMYGNYDHVSNIMRNVFSNINIEKLIHWMAKHVIRTFSELTHYITNISYFSSVARRTQAAESVITAKG